MYIELGNVMVTTAHGTMKTDMLRRSDIPTMSTGGWTWKRYLQLEIGDLVFLAEDLHRRRVRQEHVVSGNVSSLLFVRFSAIIVGGSYAAAVQSQVDSGLIHCDPMLDSITEEVETSLSEHCKIISEYIDKKQRRNLEVLERHEQNWTLSWKVIKW